MKSEELDLVLERFQRSFDRKTLSNQAIDPFVYVVLVSTANGISQSSRSFFLTEGDTIHHPVLPQQCLARAMELAATLIKNIPQPRLTNYPKFSTHTILAPISNNEVVVVVTIAENWDDAEWCTRALTNRIAPAKPA